MTSFTTDQSSEIQQSRRGEFLISTERVRLDLDAIHAFLTDCYWAKGIPKEVVARSIKHSLCFGMYLGQKQVGFARVISDYATYAYIGDVFVLDSHRGQGLGKWLMTCIIEYPEVQGLRRWTLLTRDAHGLYAQYGFTRCPSPSDIWNCTIRMSTSAPPLGIPSAVVLQPRSPLLW